MPSLRAPKRLLDASLAVRKVFKKSVDLFSESSLLHQ